MVNRQVLSIQTKFIFTHKQCFLDGIKNSKYRIITTFNRKGKSLELSCCPGKSFFHLYFKKIKNKFLNFGACILSLHRSHLQPYTAFGSRQALLNRKEFLFLILLPANICILVLSIFFIP